MPITRRTGAALPASALALALLAAPVADAASVATWDKVAHCESGGDWSINTGNGYYGGLQISRSTWNAFGGPQYAAYAHQATKEQQIRVAEKILATQGEGAWPTCGPRAGLGADDADPYPAEPPAPQTSMTKLTGVGDLTGDGVPDLIAVEAASGDLYRYNGPGFVGLGGRAKIGYGWNGISRIVAVGDLTGDRVTDVLAVDADSGELFRYAGPTFNGRTKARVGVNWDSMTNPAGVGDITGDGVPDLIAVEKATGVLYRYAGPGFNGGTRVKIGNGWNMHASVTGVGDLTGDGVADVVAVDADSGELFRYAGPHFNGGTKTKIGVAWDSMTNLTGVGDVTGDGVPDLLAVDKATQKLYRYNGPSFNGATRAQIGSGW